MLHAVMSSSRHCRSPLHAGRGGPSELAGCERMEDFNKGRDKLSK